ncbi:MAG: translocation/assembly module TamB domain-containing protein, partial [Bacteroidia bacterium]
FSRGAIDIKLTNSVLYLYNKPWVITNQNKLHYASSNLTIDSFIISNENQSIAINGMAGEKTFDKLNISITNFDLAETQPILKKWNIELEGIINGKLTLDGANHRPLVESSITIENLAYNKDSIGDVVLNSHSNGNLYKMDIDGHIKNGLINDLAINGNIDLTAGKDRIDLVCELKESNIKPFEMFTEGLFSDISGLANGVINIKGTLSRPDIDGSIEIKSVKLFMDYLGLPLRVDAATIKIDEKKIDLGTFAVYDKYGSKAKAGGKIYHKNFDNLRFDIFMKELNNFNCMELSEFQGDMFFGTAYVDGNMKVTGPIDELYLNINAKTRPRTIISLPLTSTNENAGPEFIKIVDLRADAPITQLKKLSGITMDFNFDITEDAVIKLIFDEKFNDVMTGTGNGNIKMELNTFGNFEMYGYYIIEKGGYNFTALSNLVNAKLKVKRGSKIVWNGDPLNALVDIVAITTIRADPSIILPATSASAQSTSSVAVDCEIYMKDELFKPDIKLGINLSKDNQAGLFGNSDISNAINQIKADQEETNKQFINLLVFGSFAPINSAVTAADMNVSNTFENSMGAFISSQVNNWLRQINPNWELDVDYQRATNKETNNQIMVSLKRKLYNDKVEIGGAYGKAGNQSFDANISYRINPRLRVMQFNTRGNDPTSVNNKPVNTSGLGFYYRREFDYFFPKWKKKLYDRKHNKISKN